MHASYVGFKSIYEQPELKRALDDMGLTYNWSAVWSDEFDPKLEAEFRAALASGLIDDPLTPRT